MKLRSILTAAKAVGRLAGILGRHDDGAPVRGRKTRAVSVAVAGAALAAALLEWWGVPLGVTAALTEFVAVLAAAGG